MKKNLYYRQVLKRENILKRYIYSFFALFASYPKMALEVFIRKNFGERYFSVATAITVAVLIFIYPWMGNRISLVIAGLFGSRDDYYMLSRGSEGSVFWGRFTTCYVFLIAFLFFSYKRWREVKRNPSVYDFERFSLYSGDINPVFFHIRLFKTDPSIRMIEVIYEPAVFFLAGFILHLMGQGLGMMLIICSIFYAISYAAAYKSGDNFVMGKIDEMILNEEMERAFVDELDASQTRGVRIYAKKPNSDDLRRKLTDSFIEDSEEITEAR